jgi:hypothetical protein
MDAAYAIPQDTDLFAAVLNPVSIKDVVTLSKLV